MATSIGNKKLSPPSYMPRIIIKFWDHIIFPKEIGKMDAFIKKHLIPWQLLFKRFPGIKIRRLIQSVKPERVDELEKRAQDLNPNFQPPNFNYYYAVECPYTIVPSELLFMLRKLSSVQIAYIESPPLPPPEVDASNDPLSIHQGYLDPAPLGIDARYAWTANGGDGAGNVGFVDIEQGWKLDHEDFPLINEIGGNNARHFAHGTAVLGIILMKDNSVGGVGITPSIANANVYSQIPLGIANAILAAIDSLSFGDALLLEAQCEDPNDPMSLKLWPVEIEEANFNAIRLATALGIVVIEAACNGDSGAAPVGHDIDARLIERDSGAIIVGAATSAVPHARMGYSNFGRRVNCYAWGENVSTSSTDGSGSRNMYTSIFNGTSSASAIIAGAAIAIQSMIEATYRFRYSPLQLRDILRDPVNGTESRDPVNDKIGVMPDLQRIARNILGLTSDIYIRDNISDEGNPQTANLSRSPDIIVVQNPVGNPQALYGEGSGTENDAALSDPVIGGQDHFIYLRVQNRGQSDDANVTARVYWARPSTLLTPDQWNFISNVTPGVSIDFPNVPLNVLTVSNMLTWKAADIPATGHYCFIVIVESPSDPMPAITDIINLDGEAFFQLIGNNNNIAWRNFNVVSLETAKKDGAGVAVLPFLSPGVPNETVKMTLELAAYLPPKSVLTLEVPRAYLDLLEERSPHTRFNRAKTRATFPVKHSGKHLIGKIVYPAGAKFRMKLLARIPAKYRKFKHEIYVRQLHKGKEIGRVTWRLIN